MKRDEGVISQTVGEEKVNAKDGSQKYQHNMVCVCVCVCVCVESREGKNGDMFQRIYTLTVCAS